MGGNRAKPDTDLAGYLKPLLLGTAAGCIVCGALLALAAGLLAWRGFPLKYADAVMVAAAALSAFAGAYLCARMVREKGLLLGLLCGGFLFLLLLLCGMAASGPAFSFLLPVKLCVMELSGALGGVLGVNHKSRRK